MASRDPCRPNVVLLLSDDRGPWALGCGGNPEIRTPQLDRLAATGTRFERFYCTSPVCSPARASLLTGRTVEHKYVHRHPDGPHELYDLAVDPDERVNLAGDPGHARRVDELRGLLYDWFARHAHPRREGRALPVTGKGQLGPASFHGLE